MLRWTCHPAEGPSTPSRARGSMSQWASAEAVNPSTTSTPSRRRFCNNSPGEAFFLPTTSALDKSANSMTSGYR